MVVKCFMCMGNYVGLFNFILKILQRELHDPLWFIYCLPLTWNAMRGLLQHAIEQTYKLKSECACMANWNNPTYKIMLESLYWEKRHKYYKTKMENNCNWTRGTGFTSWDKHFSARHPDGKHAATGETPSHSPFNFVFLRNWTLN